MAEDTFDPTSLGLVPADDHFDPAQLGLVPVDSGDHFDPSSLGLVPMDGAAVAAFKAAQPAFAASTSYLNATGIASALQAQKVQQAAESAQIVQDVTTGPGGYLGAVARTPELAQQPSKLKDNFSPQDYLKNAFGGTDTGSPQEIAGQTLAHQKLTEQGVPAGDQPALVLPKPEGTGVFPQLVRSGEKAVEGLTTAKNLGILSTAPILPPPLQRLLGLGFAGMMAKDIPGNVKRAVEAEPGERVEAWADAGIGAAMAVLAAHHGLSDPRSVGAELRKGGMTQEQLDKIQTQLQVNDLLPKTTSEGKQFAYTSPDIIDGLNASKQRLLKDFDDQPPEIQRQRQAVLDAIESQLLEVPRDQVNESAQRTAQPQGTTPPPTPEAAGETTGSPPAQGGRSSLFSQALAEQAPAAELDALHLERQRLADPFNHEPGWQEKLDRIDAILDSNDQTAVAESAQRTSPDQITELEALKQRILDAPEKGSVQDLSNVAQGMEAVVKDLKEHIKGSQDNLGNFAQNLVDNTVGKVNIGELGDLFPKEGIFGQGMRDLQERSKALIAPETAKALEETPTEETVARQSPLDQLKALQSDAEPIDASAEKMANDLQKLGRVNRDSTKAVAQELKYYSDAERQQLQQHLKTDDAEPDTLAKAITGRDVLKEKTTVSEYLDEPAGKEGRGHPTADVAKEAFGEDYTGGPGAMGPREAAAMAAEQNKVSIANADVNARRAAEGKPILESEERKANPVTWAEAEAKLDANPDAGKDLVKALNDGTKTSVSDADGALLTHEMITAKNLRDQWRERAGAADSTAEERYEAQTNWQKYEKQLEDVDTATRKAGTQAGRALQIRQMQIADDYTPSAMESRLRAAKQGPLTPKESADVTAAHARITELEKQLSERDQQQKYEEAKAHFDKLVKDTFTEAKSAAKAGTTITDFLSQKAQEAMARIIARRGKLQVTVDPLNVAGLVDEAIIGASHIANGIKDFAGWSKAMLDDFGDRIKPYLKDLFDSSTKYHDQSQKVFATGKTPETPSEIKATIVKGPLLQKNVYDLSRAHVKAGVDGLDNVMKAVTADLQATHPGITEREVRDAFSGYGKVTFPSKEADLAKLREYRRLGQLTSAIEDANAKSAPKKSGMQRDQPTQAIREKTKELNEAMRANGIETTSPEQQLKSANDARTTSLRNQIADLDKRLKTGEKPTSKTPTPDSPEVESLRAQRDVMKDKLDEIERPKQTAADRAADAAQKGVDRAAAALDRQQRINSGELKPEASEKVQPLSPLEKELRDRTAELRDAKKKSDSYKSPEQIAAETAQKGVDAAAAALDRWDRILKGELDRDSKSPSEPKSSLEEELRSQVDAMKQAAEEMRRNERPKTDPEAAREKAQIASLEKSTAEYERRLKDNDFSAKGQKNGIPDTQSVAQARLARDAAKKAFDDLKRAQDVVRSPEEIQLARYKTAIKNRTADIQDRIARGDYIKPVRNKVALDADAEKMKAKYEREKQKFDTKVEEQRLANRTPSQKFWDRFVGIERAMKLSSDVVLAKLTTAAVVREGVLTPTEEAVGGVVSKALPGLAARAPRQGGISFEAEMRAKTQAFTQGMKDAWDNLRMRKSDLEVTQGKKTTNVAPEWYEYMGFLHGALKAPIKRAEFARSLSKRMEFAVRNGIDVNDPHVMQRLSAESYADANRAIFMQDNVVSTAWNNALNSVRNSAKYPNLGPAVARIGEFLAPIVKVPTNIAGEVATGVHGAAVGGVRAGLAYLNGIKSLPTEQADAIMSQIKKGLVGNAILLTGYLGYKSIGGFYQKDDKRPATDVQPETYKVGGWTLPKFTGHSTAGVLLNIGATLHRVEDEKESNALGGGNKGKSVGALAATAGAARQLPLIPAVTGIMDALQTEAGFQKYIRGMITSTVTPGITQHIAKVIDTPGQFPKNAFQPENPRQPKSALDAVKVGIPGLRQQVQPPKTHRKK